MYDDLDLRPAGDIDIYVIPNKFNSAMSILKKHGFVFRNSDTINNNHHVQYIKGHIELELHKKLFNPFIKIDETYLQNNICSFILFNQNILTFNITATFLHLIYHLYMDTYLVFYKSLYYTLLNKPIPKAQRFLFRAYEIALFSEKYCDEIKWEDIIEDIKKQKLCISFEKMIMDILEIFPGAFPDTFIKTVYRLDYIENETDRLYNDMLASDKNNIGRLLCNYIDNNWTLRKENNIHIQIGDSFDLIKNSITQQCETELSCKIATKKMPDGIELTITVSDDDFCFSKIDNFDTMASDGVHLLLCSTENYSYNSIFFFPKLIDNKIKIWAYDVLNNTVLDEDFVKTYFSETKDGYIITILFSNEFIINNHMKNYFYMGLVVSDCNSEEKHRTNGIILSAVDSEWYNPIYFAKINMNE